MQTWAVRDAKARFSEFLQSCLTDGLQVVTKRGVATAVLIPIEVWQQLEEEKVAQPTLKELLLTDVGRTDLLLLPRGQAQRRTIINQIT